MTEQMENIVERQTLCGCLRITYKMCPDSLFATNGAYEHILEAFYLRFEMFTYFSLICLYNKNGFVVYTK